MSRALETTLRNFQLERVPMPSSSMEAFDERTRGMLEVAWQMHGTSPDKLAAVFRQYGFDCYAQGVCDGANVRPSLGEGSAP